MTGAKIIMRNVKSRGMVLFIALTIVSILVNTLPGIGNASDSELSMKPYTGYHGSEKQTQIMD